MKTFFFFFLLSVVDVFRKKENDAAVTIQSWYRGCKVRTYIRYNDFVEGNSDTP